MLNDIKLKFKDETLTIKANKVMGLVMAVEAVTSREDVAKQLWGKISLGYTAALNYAGLDVEHDDVHLWMNEDVDLMAEKINEVYMILFDLLIMPENLKKQSSTKKKTVSEDENGSVIKAFYQLAISKGLTRAEFFDMTITEWWWWYELQIPQQNKIAASLYETLQEAKKNEH
jgi:hypothetical protein